MVYVVIRRLLGLLVLLAGGERSKALEILALGHELSVLHRSLKRPALRPHERLLLAAFSQFLPRDSWHAFFVTPETLLRWHRRLVARHWTYPHRRPGRPTLSAELGELVLRLARENPSWGYGRIVGEVQNLGLVVSAGAATRQDELALLPASPGGKHPGGRLLHCGYHLASALLACWSFSRSALAAWEYVAVTANPTSAWVCKQARNLLMDLDDRHECVRFLVHDRDAKFARAFDELLGSAGIKAVHTPYQTPTANAVVERFIGSARRECLDRLLVVGQRRLLHVLSVYVSHYNAHRPHRALGLRAPDSVEIPPPKVQPNLALATLQRRDLLGGLLHEYRAAA